MAKNKHCKLGMCIKTHERITCKPNGVQCEYYVELPKATAENGLKEYYACPHCGKPTTGRIIGMAGKKLIRTMCDECDAYIGSPAAMQEGATMQNRIEMQKQYEQGEQKNDTPKPSDPIYEGEPDFKS